MNDMNEKSSVVSGIKKGSLAMVILHLLELQDRRITEIMDMIREESDGFLTISHPLNAINRLKEKGYIEEYPTKQIMPGRKSVKYRITEQGRIRLAEMKEEYKITTSYIQKLLQP